jgi:Tfp pilus assembly protein FimT
MYSKIRTSKKTQGFTLVETLTYGVGLIIILGGMTTFIFYLYDWYRSATIPTRADQIGIDLIGRISNDIRAANSVNDSGTVLNVQGGAISVTTSGGAISTTTVYTLQNGVMKYKVNSNATTSVSGTDVWVSGFYVKKLTTTNSDIVRIEIDIDYRTKTGTTTNVYNGVAVLRQSY